MKVNICGIPHEIIEAKDTFDLDTHFGQIDYKSCRICINEDMPSAIKKATICHEIMHGILVHIGRGDLSNDEVLVTSLGNTVAQTFNIKFMGESDKKWNG